MANYLIMRNNVYYFCMRIPSNLVTQFATPTLRKSLKTNSKIEAMRFSNILVSHFKKLFDLIEKDMLTKKQITKIVSKIYIGALSGYEEIRITEPGTTEEVEEFIAHFPRHILKDLLRKNKTEFFQNLADKILEEEGIQTNKDSLEYKTLLREILKAFAEVCEVEKQRYEGNYLNDYDKQNSYTLASYTNPSLKSTHDETESISVSKLIEEYKKEQKRANNWAPKTELDFNSYFNTFQEIIGDVNIKNINHKMLLEYRDKLSQLPPNRNKQKRFKGKTINQILAMDNVNPMSLKTINNHLSLVATLFNFAERHDYIDKTPAKNLTFKQKTKASNDRNVYSVDDLRLIFQEITKVNKAKNPERFWVPLIALHTGMRLNEICQLHIEDILQHNGIYYFDINANGNNKRIKTINGVRKVPVHQILIDLGLLDYVKNIKAGQIWKKLPYNPKHGYSYLFQKWFQRINRSKITSDRKKSFHSFRHNVADNLKQQQIDTHVIAQILGHSTGSITAERYGKEYQPETLLKALHKLDYGIDIHQALLPK